MPHPDSNTVRVTSPAALYAAPDRRQTITVLPAGAVISVIRNEGTLLKVHAVMGAKNATGFIDKAQTNWQG